MAALVRILCVGPNLDESTRALRSSGYEVMLVSTLQAALAVLHLFPPSLIVLEGGAVDEPARKLPARYGHVPLLLVPNSTLDVMTLQERISKLVEQRWQAQAG